MFDFIGLVIRSLTLIDGLIIILALINGYMYFQCMKHTNSIYNHFNSQDKIRNLSEEQKNAVQSITQASGNEKRLSSEELLNEREKMNQFYSGFTSMTSTFPLWGMLGTVVSLLNMTDLIGTEATGAFLGALTSTFFGIIAAIAGKLADSFISYKIEDNEKHMDYLFNPSKKQA